MAAQSLRVINVVNADKYEDCKIPGSINVPLSELKDYAQSLDKFTPIVVYCANYKCTFSTQAWHILYALGFENVLAYEGGMAEWYQKGYPVEGACQMSYLQEITNPQEDRGTRTITAQDLKTKLKL